MKRIKVLALLALLAAGTAFADPALGGGRGLFRVQDARVEEDGALVFANRWMVNRQETPYESMLYFGPLYGFEVSYAPFPIIEMFGCLNGTLSYETDVNSLRYDWQGQTVGAKLSIPFLPVLKLAARCTTRWRRPTTPAYMDGLDDGRLLRPIGALRFWELYKTLPTLMFNYGEDFNDADRFIGAGSSSHPTRSTCSSRPVREPVEGVGFFDEGARIPGHSRRPHQGPLLPLERRCRARHHRQRARLRGHPRVQLRVALPQAASPSRGAGWRARSRTRAPACRSRPPSVRPTASSAS